MNRRVECKICKSQGHFRPFKDSQALGRHTERIHGIPKNGTDSQ